jgi:uncharacterized protein
MKTTQKDNIIFIRLFPNEDIIENILDACEKHQVRTAVVLSAVGQLKDITLGYYKEKGNYTPQSFKEAHELLHISGTIIKQEDKYIPHLHVTLGNEQKMVLGGHLLKAKVEVTNEIVLLSSDALLKRRLCEENGLQELILPDAT